MTPTARRRLSERTHERNQQLDFTKGSLVLLMVVYHWLNYFVPVTWDVYRYLRFLTPSFILITGFLISHIHLSKHSPDDPRLLRRLLERGSKILLLFTVANLAGALILNQDHDVAPFLSNSYAIYVTGNGGAVFDVLVPIGYFLLLSPLVLIASKHLGLSLQLAGGAAVATAITAYAAGVRSPNLELLAIAMLGMALGAQPFDRITRVLNRPLLLALSYILYVAAITKWNVVLPLQLIGVCLTLLLIYWAAIRAGSEGWAQRRLIDLGRYSLFAYIAHILALQLLERGLRSFDLRGSELLIPFVSALVFTVLAVELVTLARHRSDAIDRLYRVVFA